MIWNEDLLPDYISLLESQITDNLRTLHWFLLGAKTWVDKVKITFQYLFEDNAQYPEKKVVTKRPLRIYGQHVPWQQ